MKASISIERVVSGFRILHLRYTAHRILSSRFCSILRLSPLSILFFFAFTVLCVLFIGIQISDAETGDIAYEWTEKGEVNPNLSVSVSYEVKYSYRDHLIAYFDGQLHIYDSVNRTIIFNWNPSHEIRQCEITWSRNDSEIAIIDYMTVIIFEKDTGHKRIELPFESHPSDLEFSRDDKQLAILVNDVIYIYETVNWTVIKELAIDGKRIYEFKWSPFWNEMFLFTDTGIYGFNSTNWNGLLDLKNDSIGAGGSWTNDAHLVYPAEINCILDYDLENDSIRTIAHESFLTPDAHVLYDSEMDDVIFFYEAFPRVFDRKTGFLLQVFSLSIPNREYCFGVDISSDGHELSILWRDNMNVNHLTQYGKKQIPIPKQDEDNPTVVFSMLKEYHFGYELPSKLAGYKVKTVQVGFDDCAWLIYDNDGSYSVTNPQIICTNFSYDNSSLMYIQFRTWFNWSFQVNYVIPIILRIEMVEGTIFQWRYENSLRVITELVFEGDPLVEGEIQGPLANNSWVKSGEILHWSIARVHYKGYRDISPPPGEVSLMLERNGIVEWTDNPEFNATTGISLNAPNTTIARLEYHVAGKIVRTAVTFDEAWLILNVDGIPPEFLGFLQEPDRWSSVEIIPLAAWIWDGRGSGVNETSIELTWRIGQTGEWMPWKRTSVKRLENGTLFCMLPTEFKEGIDNFVRWRCTDMVGNANESNELRVLIDLHHVTFKDFKPNDWTNFTEVACSVFVSDLAGSGVKGESVSVRWSTSGLSGYGPWLDMSLTGTRETWPLEWNLHLLEGEDNYIQWRANDVAGTGLTESPHYRIMVDLLPPTIRILKQESLLNSRVFELSIEVVDPGGSGVNTSQTRWSFIDGEVVWNPMDITQGTYSSVAINVSSDGPYRINFRAGDIAGNEALSEVFTVIIDTLSPEFADPVPASGSFIQGLVRRVSIDISDEQAGVNRSRVEYSYAFGRETDWSDWYPVEDSTLQNGTVRATVLLNVTRSHENWIRFRAWDLLGNGPSISEDIQLPVDLPPVAKILAPTTSGEYWAGTMIAFNASGSVDAENGTLTFAWIIGSEQIRGPVFSRSLGQGVYRVVLVVTDDSGQSNRTEMDLTVLPVRVKEQGSIWSWVFALISVLAISAIVVFLIWIRRNRISR